MGQADAGRGSGARGGPPPRAARRHGAGAREALRGMIIRFVLDAGAVAACARGTENLGELLTELADEAVELDADLGFEIPAICLPSALRSDPKMIDTVRLLAAHSLCRVRNP